MYSLCKGPYRIFLRLTAMAVLTAFVVNFVFNDAWALVNDTVTGEHFSGAAVKSDFAVLDADTFSIPSHLGEIVDHRKGTSGKTVVHIQDAHANLFAQKKISDIIEYLTTEYGIQVVNLEGGAGEYDLTPFTSIADSDIRREVSEHFVGTGEINGAEFFAVNSPGKVRLWGVEDEELYLKNLGVYRDSLSYKEEVTGILDSLTKMLNVFKKAIYSRELMNLDMAYNAYKSGKMEFRDYLAGLVKSARDEGVSIEPYTNVYMLSRALAAEKNIDFEKANIQRNALINELEKKLSQNEIKGLVEKTLEFRTKRISSGVFYNYLAQKAHYYRISLERYPALSAYVDYVNLYDSVDKRGVMKEFDGLEQAVREKIYTGDVQKELDGLSRKLALLKNIFDLRLTKTDYDRYLAEKDLFTVRSFTDFISSRAGEYNIKWTEPGNFMDLDGYLSRMTKFYEYSFSRDEVFVEKMMFSGDLESPSGVRPREVLSQDSAILMTGGFHTDNLCELLEKKGISYISIMPRFTVEEDYVSPYFELLAGGRPTNIERMLNTVIARAAMLALADKMTSLGPRVWGKNEIATFNAVIYLVTLLTQLEREMGEDGKRAYGLELLESRENPETVRGANGLPVVFTLDKNYGNDGDLKTEINVRPVYMEDLRQAAAGKTSTEIAKAAEKAEAKARAASAQAIAQRLKDLPMTTEEALMLLEAALRIMTDNPAVQDAMTEKYAVHLAMEELGNAERLVVVTAEPSGLSELNERWGHTAVDKVRDALGRGGYEYVVAHKQDFSEAGAGITAYYNPYGGRWHFIFSVKKEYDKDKFEAALEKMLKSSVGSARDTARRLGEKDADKFNAILGISRSRGTGSEFRTEPFFRNAEKEKFLAVLTDIISAEDIALSPALKGEVEQWIASLRDSSTESYTSDKEGKKLSKFDDLLDVLSRKIAENPILKMLVAERLGITTEPKKEPFRYDLLMALERLGAGEYYKDIIGDLVKESHRMVMYAENEYYPNVKNIPQLASREFREARNVTLFDSPAVNEGTRLVFFPDEASDEWLRDSWVSSSAKGRFKDAAIPRNIPDGEKLKKEWEYLVDQINKRGIVSEYLKDRMVRFIDDELEIALESRYGVLQGVNVINTLMKKYADIGERRGSGSVFRVNIDFDFLSKVATPAAGDELKSRGAAAIKEEFERAFNAASSRFPNVAATVHAGTGDEMAVIGYFDGPSEDLEKIVLDAMKQLNGIPEEGTEGRLGKIEFEGKPIRYQVVQDGKNVTWIPSISAGFAVVDVKKMMPGDLETINSRADIANRWVKDHGRRGAAFYEARKHPGKVESEDIDTNVVTDVLVPYMAGVDDIVPYLGDNLMPPVVAEPEATEVSPQETRAPPTAGFVDRSMFIGTGIMTAASFLFFTAAMWITASSGAYAIQDAFIISAKTTGLLFGAGVLAMTGLALRQRGSERSKDIGSILAVSAAALFMLFLPAASRSGATVSREATTPAVAPMVVKEGPVDVEARWQEYWASDEYKDKMAIERYNAGEVKGIEDAQRVLLDLALGENHGNIIDAYGLSPERWKNDREYRMRQYRDIWRSVRARFYSADKTSAGRRDFVRDGYPVKDKVTVAAIGRNSEQYSCARTTEKNMEKNWYFDKNRVPTLGLTAADVKEVESIVSRDARDFLREDIPANMANEPYFYHSKDIEMPKKWEKVDPSRMPDTNSVDPAHIFYPLKITNLVKEYGVVPKTPVKGATTAGKALDKEPAQGKATILIIKAAFRWFYGSFLGIRGTDFETRYRDLAPIVEEAVFTYMPVAIVGMCGPWWAMGAFSITFVASHLIGAPGEARALADRVKDAKKAVKVTGVVLFGQALLAFAMQNATFSIAAVIPFVAWFIAALFHRWQNRVSEGSMTPKGLIARMAVALTVIASLNTALPNPVEALPEAAEVRTEVRGEVNETDAGVFSSLWGETSAKAERPDMSVKGGYISAGLLAGLFVVMVGVSLILAVFNVNVEALGPVLGKMVIGVVFVAAVLKAIFFVSANHARWGDIIGEKVSKVLKNVVAEVRFRTPAGSADPGKAAEVRINKAVYILDNMPEKFTDDLKRETLDLISGYPELRGRLIDAYIKYMTASRDRSYDSREYLLSLIKDAELSGGEVSAVLRIMMPRSPLEKEMYARALLRTRDLKLTSDDLLVLFTMLAKERSDGTSAALQEPILDLMALGISQNPTQAMSGVFRWLRDIRDNNELSFFLNIIMSEENIAAIGAEDVQKVLNAFLELVGQQIKMRQEEMRKYSGSGSRTEAAQRTGEIFSEIMGRLAGQHPGVSDIAERKIQQLTEGVKNRLSSQGIRAEEMTSEEALSSLVDLKEGGEISYTMRESYEWESLQALLTATQGTEILAKTPSAGSWFAPRWYSRGVAWGLETGLSLLPVLGVLLFTGFQAVPSLAVLGVALIPAYIFLRPHIKNLSFKNWRFSVEFKDHIKDPRAIRALTGGTYAITALSLLAPGAFAYLAIGLLLGHMVWNLWATRAPTADLKTRWRVSAAAALVGISTFFGGIFPALSVIVGGTALVALTGCEEYSGPNVPSPESTRLDETQAASISSAVGTGFGRSVSAGEVASSMRLSNSDMYQGIVSDAYGRMESTGIWDEGRRFPVLFLEGVEDIGESGLALFDLSVIVISKATFDNMTARDPLWLSYILGHEGQHIVNANEDPGISRLGDEASANLTMARIADALGSEHAERYYAGSDAFSILVDKSGDVSALFGGADFNRIYYRGLAQKGVENNLVIVELYNEADTTQPSIFVEVDRSTRSFRVLNAAEEQALRDMMVSLDPSSILPVGPSGLYPDAFSYMLASAQDATGRLGNLYAAGLGVLGIAMGGRGRKTEDEAIRELGTELVSRDFEVRYISRTPTRVFNMSEQENDILRRMNAVIAEYVDTAIIDGDVLTNAVDGIFKRFDDEYDEYEEPEEQGRITLKIIRNDATGTISIVVSDNGSGIPHSMMEKWKEKQFTEEEQFVTRKPGPDADGNFYYIGGMNQGIRHILTLAALSKYDVSFISKESFRDGPALRFTQAADGTISRDMIDKASPGTSLVVTIPASEEAAPEMPAAPAPGTLPEVTAVREGVSVIPFTSERGPETYMAVARFAPGEVMVIPHFQSTMARVWGMLRDRVLMYFKYQLVGEEVQEVDDLKPDYENARKDVWTIEQHLEEFRRQHPDLEIVGFVGNGNILANPSMVSYVDGKLYAVESEKEKIHEGRRGGYAYPSLIYWKDGRFSVEEVFVTRDERIMRKNSAGEEEDITAEIATLNAGVGLLMDGDNYDMATHYEQDYDIRHQLDFPFLGSLNSAFGIAQFYDEQTQELKEDLCVRAIRGEPVSLSLMRKKDGKRIDLTTGQIDELISNLGKEKGYKAAASIGEVGYGSYYIDRGKRTITIGLMRGISPHNIAGIDRDGNLVSIVVAGESNRVGITFKEAQEKLKELGVTSAVVFDNGADAMMTMGEKVIVPSFQKRDRFLSLLIFARPKAMPEEPAPETPAAVTEPRPQTRAESTAARMKEIDAFVKAVDTSKVISSVQHSEANGNYSVTFTRGILERYPDGFVEGVPDNEVESFIREVADAGMVYRQRMEAIGAALREYLAANPQIEVKGVSSMLLAERINAAQRDAAGISRPEIDLRNIDILVSENQARGAERTAILDTLAFLGMTEQQINDIEVGSRKEEGGRVEKEGVVLAAAQEGEVILPTRESEDMGFAASAFAGMEEGGAQKERFDIELAEGEVIEEGRGEPFAPAFAGLKGMKTGTSETETMAGPAGVTSGFPAKLPRQSPNLAGPVIGSTLPAPIKPEDQASTGTVVSSEKDAEKPIRQMAAALAAAKEISSDVANWVITPTNENKETEKASVFSMIRWQYERSSGHRADTRINGYVYNSGLSDKDLEDNLRATFKSTLTQMTNSLNKTPEKDARAVAFVPADKYDIAFRALKTLEMPNKDRIRIVKEQGIDPTGLVNELHHADLGRELLNYDRIVDRPEAEIDRERAQGAASRTIAHIKAIAEDPFSSVLDGDPTKVLNSFLNGGEALPAMEKMNPDKWKEAHEALLAVRRSL